MALIDNLVSYWKLDEVAGNAIDAHGTNDGVVTEAIQGAAGKINTAYSFDGINDKISMADNSGLDGATESVSLWVNLDSTLEDGAFFQVGHDFGPTGNASLGWAVGVGGTTYDNPGNNLIILYEGVRWINTATAIGTGWHHIVVTIDGAGVPTAYLDNASLGAFAGAGPTDPSAYEIHIGGYDANLFARYVDAIIDEVAVWNKILSVAEVAELWNGGAGLAYPFVVGTNMQVNISDVLKDVSEIKINIGGVLKDVTEAKINIGGVLKDIF